MADDLDEPAEDPSDRRERQQEKEKGEEPQKSYETILEQQILAGVTELERPAANLFLSGLSAGLDVSLSLLLMAAMRTLTEGTLPHAVSEILLWSTLGNVVGGIVFVALIKYGHAHTSS